MWVERGDGLCPRCEKHPAMTRKGSDFHGPVMKLARTLGGALPPPLCEECLEAFRQTVTKQCQKDCVVDQGVWDDLRSGRINGEEFFSRIRDVGLYRDGANAILAKRRSGKEAGKI
jgi:hypothetical protein